MQLVRRQNVIAMQPRRHWLIRWANRLLEAAHAIGLRAKISGRLKRRMSVLETLPLGGRKQLLLIQCGDAQFLVGTGAESVQTMVRVRPESGLEDTQRAHHLGEQV